MPSLIRSEAISCNRSFQVIRPGGIFVTVAAGLAEEAGRSQNIRAVGGRRASCR